MKKIKIFLLFFLLLFTSCFEFFGAYTSEFLAGIWVSQQAVSNGFFTYSKYFYFDFNPTSSINENGDFSGNYQIRTYNTYYNNYWGWNNTGYNTVESGSFYVNYLSNRISLNPNFNMEGDYSPRYLNFNLDYNNNAIRLVDNRFFYNRTIYLKKIKSYW